MNEGLANIMEKEKIKKDADKLMIKKIKMYENQKSAIIMEIREMLNVYQDTMTKDVEQSLRNLIDFIQGLNNREVTDENKWMGSICWETRYFNLWN